MGKYIKLRNLVAKHSETFNKPKTFRDRTKFNKKRKHKNKDYSKVL